MIITKIKRPEFFLFSDDPDWCKQNIAIDYPLTVVSDEQRSDTQELMLMSKCRHHIIANSTYSWWGAWLNPNQEKIVIAPPRWYNNRVAPDILPDRWIKIVE